MFIHAEYIKVVINLQRFSFSYLEYLVDVIRFYSHLLQTGILFGIAIPNYDAIKPLF